MEVFVDDSTIASTDPRYTHTTISPNASSSVSGIVFAAGHSYVVRWTYANNGAADGQTASISNVNFQNRDPFSAPDPTDYNAVHWTVASSADAAQAIE